MAKQTINIGSVANDGTGDPLRTAFNKVNQNFTELYTDIENLPTDISEFTDTSGLLFDGSYDNLTDKPTIATDVSDLNDAQHIISRRYEITRRNYTLRNISPSSIQPGNFIPQDANEEFVTEIKDTTSIIFHTEDNDSSNFSTLFENAKNQKQSFELYITNNGSSRDVFLTKDVDYISDSNAYRGYKASFNNVFNSGKKSVNQIVVYEDTITPSTTSSNTASDDFNVSGLSGSSTIAVITLFNSTENIIGRGQLWNFFKEFVDKVLYTGESINNIETAKVRFYDNILDLKNAVPVLYPNFWFYANTAITANSSIVTGGSGSGASFSLLTGRHEGEPWRINSLLDGGSGYNVDETLTISGSDLGGTSFNNLSILISGVDGSGTITGYEVSETSGPAINVWPTNSIENGGDNQYNTTGNIINTNIGNDLDYNQGNRFPVSDLGSTLFGSSSSYNVLYKDSIFVVIAKNADITSLNFAGTFGNDGNIEKSHGALIGVRGYRVYVESLAIEGTWYDQAGYDISYSYAGYDVPRFSALAITQNNITNWNDAYSWGNHNDEDYMKKRRTYAVIQNTTGVRDHFAGSYREYLHISPVSNWTVNVTGLSLNFSETTDISLTIDQGATPYLPTALQIAGSPQTINWQGGSAPTGTSNGVDVITFSILYTESGYYVQGWQEGVSSGVGSQGVQGIQGLQGLTGSQGIQGTGINISSVNGDIIPDTDSSYDLGSATNQWRSLYVSANTIFVGGTPISVDVSGNLIVDGTPVVETIESVSASNNFTITAGETNTWEFNASGNIIFPNGQQINAEDANELLIGTTNAGLILNSQTQSSRLVAKKTFDREFNYGVDQEIDAIVGPPHLITVTFGTDTGLYLLPLLARLQDKLSNELTDFRFDYSNIRMVINPYAEAIPANILMVSQASGTTWNIAIDQDPTAVVGNVTDIQILYDYNNTVGLDVGEDMFGIATDNDDIDIRSGRDIDLIAADDITFRAGSTFDLTLLRNDGQAPDDGIEIITESSTQTNIWRFQFSGLLQVPGNIAGTGGIVITPENGEAYAYLNLPSDEDSSSQGVALGNDNGKIELRTTDQATSSSYTWRFDNDGSLTAPGTITSTAIQTDSITIGVGGNVNGQGATLGNFSSIDTGELINEGNVSIVVANTHTWSFGSNGDIEVPGKIILANGAQIFDTAGIENSITIGATDTNGTTTFNGSGFFNGNVYFHKAIQEKFTSLQDATGVVTHDCANSHIFYHTSPDANWTVNLTNFPLVLNYATTVTLIISQGVTGYYPSALQIGGAAQTINWQGNTTPTPSSNRVDVVSFSIYRTGAGYTVLGQLVGF